MPSPPRPPASTEVAGSFCEPHRTFIEAPLRLSRNAMAIYQELVDGHGFTGRYNSVKRFVARTLVREPEQFDRLADALQRVDDGPVAQATVTTQSHDLIRSPQEYGELFAMAAASIPQGDLFA